MRITRDPDLAADAVQEAFAAALQNASSFRQEARPSTWLHRIVYNKSIDLLRRRRREQPLPEESPEFGAEDEALSRAVSGAPSPEALLAGDETRQALEAALAELTPVQRAAFELFEIEGLGSDQVGEILGIPAGTARVYRHRARLKLRAALAPHVPGGA